MEQTSAAWPGSVVVVKETTGSTMDDARALALSGCASGSAVLAGFQERGRGRVPGRSWISPPGESMLATIIIRRGDMLFPLAELPLRSGVAAARAIDDVSGLAVMVKWPNDLVFGGRKLGGLLCEARGDAAFVGIGVNCLQTGFPGGLGLPACSIRQASGRVVAPRDLLRAVLFRLREAMDDSGWLRFLVDRLEGRGSVVRVDVPGSDRSYSGVLETVDEKGCLVLRTATGDELHVPQGEITSAR